MLFTQWEVIKFAQDWKRKGRQSGGKSYKKQFACMVYHLRTGKQPPDKNRASKEEKATFKKFKNKLEKTITCRNYLSEMYEQV
jgi:hypothetical protein